LTHAEEFAMSAIDTRNTDSDLERSFGRRVVEGFTDA
jgi:hypothetical protein